MKRLNYFVGLSILGALILAAVAFAPANADPPVIERYVLDFDFDEESCGFPIPSHLYGKETTKLFYDKDGLPRAGVDSYGDLSVTETWNGHTLTWHDAEHSRWRAVGEGLYTVEFTGLVWGVSVPGSGRAVASTGRLVLGCHQEGEEEVCDEVLHSSGMNVQDIDAVCNYMINGK